MLEDRLYIKRMKEEWGRERKALFSVLDWTILLYFIVPIIAFSTYFYIQLWINPPSFIFTLTLHWLVLIFISTSFFGSYRSFIEEADLLFLGRRPFFIIKMNRVGWGVLLGQSMFQLLFIHGIMFPMILHSKIFVLEKYYLLVLITWIQFLYVKVIDKLNRRWIVKMGTLLLFYLFFYFSILHLQNDNLIPYFFIIIMLSMLIISYLQQSKQGILSTIAYEQMKNGYFTKLIYQLSFEIEKDYGKKEYISLFKNSKLLFTKRAPSIVRFEIFMKLFLRSKTFLKGYSSILAVTVLGIFMLPFILKILFMILFYFFLSYWFYIMWQKVWKSSGHPMFLSLLENKNQGSEYSYSYWTICSITYAILSIVFLASLSIHH